MVEFAFTLAFTLALGVFLLWQRRTIVTAVIFAVFSITVVALAIEMHSRPKPVAMEWRTAETADVLWYEMDEGQALYFVLRMPKGPRFYVMPWDSEQAEQLLKAGREAGEGGTIKMSWPFEPSLAEDERLFYAAPQPAPPPKG